MLVEFNEISNLSEFFSQFLHKVIRVAYQSIETTGTLISYTVKHHDEHFDVTLVFDGGEKTHLVGLLNPQPYAVEITVQSL